MIAKRRKQKQRRRRGGYVLVLVVLLLFGIMAMAALVIDIGFARLTQRQMQTAVDAASLEGLRYRDGLWPEATSTNLDLERRNAASLTAARMFDDNLFADNDDPWNFGAGPIVNFSGGAGDPALNASKYMTIPATPVYKPTGSQQLKRNLGANDANGDMLPGNFDENSLTHSEDAAYVRSDFGFAQGGNAFLVRMRRSNESFAGTDKASNGPSLPYLFARGSLINRASIGNGITVRATGIANAKSVVKVGKAIPASGIVGALGIAIRESAWGGLPLDDDDPLTNEQVPRTLDGIAFGALATPTQTIGSAFNLLTVSPVSTIRGYVAIIDVVGSTDKVIGFGFAEVGPDFATPPSGILVTKLVRAPSLSTIAKENATSRLSEAWSSLGLLSDADRQIVMDRNKILVHPLLAPVSGR